MHHGTNVKHVPWCMSGSLTRGGRENVPGIPGACATHNFACLVRGPYITAGSSISGMDVKSSNSVKAPVTHSLQPVGDLLATKISCGRREVAGWLQGSRRLVADRLQKVAGTILVARRFWLLQVKPLCDQIDHIKVFGGRRQVADWSPTDRRPVAAVADNPDTVFSRRLIADQSPIGCRPISK